MRSYLRLIAKENKSSWNQLAPIIPASSTTGESLTVSVRISPEQHRVIQQFLNKETIPGYTDFSNYFRLALHLLIQYITLALRDYEPSSLSTPLIRYHKAAVTAAQLHHQDLAMTEIIETTKKEMGFALRHEMHAYAKKIMREQVRHLVDYVKEVGELNDVARVILKSFRKDYGEYMPNCEADLRRGLKSLLKQDMAPELEKQIREIFGEH